MSRAIEECRQGIEDAFDRAFDRFPFEASEVRTKFTRYACRTVRVRVRVRGSGSG